MWTGIFWCMWGSKMSLVRLTIMGTYELCRNLCLEPAMSPCHWWGGDWHVWTSFCVHPRAVDSGEKRWGASVFQGQDNWGFLPTSSTTAASMEHAVSCAQMGNLSNKRALVYFSTPTWLERSIVQHAIFSLSVTMIPLIVWKVFLQNSIKRTLPTFFGISFLKI